MNFASKNFKYLISITGISQISLEPVLNKRQQTISNYINGKFELEAEDLVRLSDFFGINIDDFCLVDLSAGNLITEAYVAKFKEFGNLKGNPIGNLKEQFHKINGDKNGVGLTMPGAQEVDTWVLLKLMQQMDEKIDQIKLLVEKGQKK